jgi:hypothetical protein
MKLPLILPSLALLWLVGTVSRVTVAPHSRLAFLVDRPTATCTVYRQNGTVIQGEWCNWTSRNTAIATVSTGVAQTTITPRQLGGVWIVAGRGGKQDSLRLTVVKVDSVVLRPPTLALVVPTASIICAIARLSNGGTTLLPPQDTMLVCKDRLAAYRLGL